MNPFNAFHRLSARGGRRRRRGQGLVEFSLILPLFLLLILILFDFGRVIYAQNAINNDAREGARVAIVNAPAIDATPTAAQVLAARQKYADIRTAAQRFSPLVPLTPANITGRPGVTCAVPDNAVPGVPTDTCFYAAQTTAGNEIEVNIRITVPIITPIISNILGGSYTLTANSVNFIQCSGC